MQNTNNFTNSRQSVTFCNSIFHLAEKVTNYLFILHSKINKIASRADDVIKKEKDLIFTHFKTSYYSGVNCIKYEIKECLIGVRMKSRIRPFSEKFDFRG